MIQTYCLFLIILLACLLLDSRHHFYLYLFFGILNMLVLETFHVNIMIQLADGLFITLFSAILLSLPVRKKKEYYLGKKGIVTQEIYITTPGVVKVLGQEFTAIDGNGLGIEKGTKVKVIDVADDYVEVIKNG